MTASQGITIRDATPEDLPQVLNLIKELALFEKAPEEVTLTLEQFTKDGFEGHPYYYVIVAEKGDRVVGIALYYIGYSTWKGKKLYLDDLVVTESHRREGIGKLLFDALIEAAKKHDVNHMRWHVLDWNEPAIQFYHKIKAKLESEWVTCKLSREGIAQYEKQGR